jgi:aspartate racemase
LLLPDGETRSNSGRVVNLVDPTDVLAKRCVAYALGQVGTKAGMRELKGLTVSQVGQV